MRNGNTYVLSLLYIFIDTGPDSQVAHKSVQFEAN